MDLNCQLDKNFYKEVQSLEHCSGTVAMFCEYFPVLPVWPTARNALILPPQVAGADHEVRHRMSSCHQHCFNENKWEHKLAPALICLPRKMLALCKQLPRVCPHAVAWWDAMPIWCLFTNCCLNGLLFVFRSSRPVAGPFDLNILQGGISNAFDKTFSIIFLL